MGERSENKPVTRGNQISFACWLFGGVKNFFMNRPELFLSGHNGALMAGGVPSNRFPRQNNGASWLERFVYCPNSRSEPSFPLTSLWSAEFPRAAFTTGEEIFFSQWLNGICTILSF